ncbi:MAG: type II toxin-antitoxin system PemK/MazF family toxin [Candidatus Sumerlaeota bacterium]|nr:type II toxin-antitoxin system PemK/MazF family toxin [Candidatus Sumerlaeota bacterium]
MTVQRGDVWLANLNPARGSEQAGIRPILVFQNDAINRFTTTVLAIPLTTNLQRAALPSCVRVAQGQGGLERESVLLCHQLRALDKTRLERKLGFVDSKTMAAVERCVLFTTGIVWF